jgi:hypothetical protein
VSAVRGVRYLVPRAVGATVVYQSYYLLGLERLTRVRWARAPLATRLVPGSRNKVRAIFHLRGNRHPLLERTRRLARRSASETPGYVGRYVAETARGAVRFAIDSHDARDVYDEEALRWSDVYFKSNRWADYPYDPKVAPVVNGNGLLDARRIERLRQLRDRERDVDVAFISNFYGGRPHVLRLFQELAGLGTRADLLAIFDGADPEDDGRYMRVLGQAGVPCATAPLPPEELWHRLASARVVLVRAGRHACVPWRMLDLLCMGACILLDAPTPARWPVPLRDGVELADCGIARPLDGTAAPEGEYDKLASTVRGLLERPGEAAQLRVGAARYFDEHAAPERVAEYVLSLVANPASLTVRPHRTDTMSGL